MPQSSPPPAQFSVSALGPSDAAAYNAFLRQGTLDHPSTLRISPADIDRAPFRTDSNSEGATFVARDREGRWLGVVSLEREAREKRRHVVWVQRMYVARSFSGAGIGRALLTAALVRARSLPGAEKVNLTVAAHNDRAIALYEAAGFHEIGREPDAFRDEEQRTELTMTFLLFGTTETGATAARGDSTGRLRIR
jgi:RimJ/RimL family protein N-acetyltransferase